MKEICGQAHTLTEGVVQVPQIDLCDVELIDMYGGWMPFATAGHFAIRKISASATYICTYVHVKNPITTCNEPQNKNDSTDSQEQIFHHSFMAF